MTEINKQLATMEDLAQGVGNVTQVRGKDTLVLSKVAVPYGLSSVAELQALDTSKFSLAKVFGANGTVEYIFAEGEWQELLSVRDKQLQQDVTTLAETVAGLDVLNALNALEAAAIAQGTSVDNVICSTDTTSAIPANLFVADTGVTYLVPEAAQGELIVSVTNGTLTTASGSYTLIPVDNQPQVIHFATVADMLSNTTALGGSVLFKAGQSLRTFAYNRAVTSDWVVSASVLTEFALELDNGLFAVLQVGASLHCSEVGVYGDAVEDDTAPYLTSLSLASSYGAVLHAEGMTGIRITSQISIPADSELVNGKTVFIIDYTQTGSGAAIKNEGVITVDRIITKLLAGHTFRRVIGITNDGESLSDIGSLQAFSVDQQSNRVSSLDAAIGIEGNKVNVRYMRSVNFDNCFKVIKSENINIESMYGKSYVRGLLTRTVNDFEYGRIKMKGLSPNASTDPGNNGTLYEECVDGTIVSTTINQCGEHGVRIGGDVGAVTKNLTFGTITVYKPGQCAFKVNPDASTYAEKITVGSITSTDCATGNAVGSNEDVCRLENAKDVVIGSINGNVEDKANCGYDGIYMNNVDRVTIGVCQFANPLRSMVTLEDTKGPCKNISVGNFTLNQTSGYTVYINCPTESTENVRIKDGYARDLVPDAPTVLLNLNGVPNPIIIGFDVEVTNWSSPGAVTSDDLWSTASTSGRLYNQITPYN